MANNQLPFHVRATDAVHRLTVLGLVGICVVGGGSIALIFGPILIMLHGIKKS